jgi:hypothetical protein
VDALDNKNATPLHHAVKYGNENIVAFLLEERADLTKKRGGTEDTPLHLARTPKIARLLLDYGADPDAINKKGHDVLTSLMKKTDTMDDVAKVIMDDCIGTNGAEMDSRDLSVVFNLEFFRKKGQDEFSKLKKMDRQESDLLYHPLSEAMIRLKWNKTWKSRYATNILKTIFAASFTFYIIGDVEKEHNKLLSQRQLGNETENGTQDTTNPTVQDKCLTFKNFASHHFNLFVYFTTFLSALLLLFSEIYQLFRSPLHYLKGTKNVLDLTMISFTIVYLLLVVLSFCEISYTEFPAKYIAAISIFLAWVNIIFMISGFPKVGIYIHMFMNVSRTLLFFVLIYSPAVIAFALSFRVLMPPEVKAFDRLWISGLKTMAMLVGELDYDGTFINNENFPNEDGLLIQIMSMLFLCFGSIVIMNLLVGLTVSEIEKLQSEAWQVSLKEMFTELLTDQKACCKGGGKSEKEKKETSPILKELLSKRKKFNIETNESLKICVRPNERDTDEIEDKSSSDEIDGENIEEVIRGTWYTMKENILWLKRRFIPKKCKVYFHDEGNKQNKYTGFQFQKGIIENTVKYLKEKEKMRHDLEAQLIGTDDMEDVVSKHTDEILDFLRKRLGTGLEK